MAGNYLKKYYLDDAKLAQRARLEFARALRTRRMTAFVGSMATQAFGYGSWTQLRIMFVGLARQVIDSLDDILERDRKKAQDQILFLETQVASRKIDTVAALSLVEEVLDSAPVRKATVNWGRLTVIATKGDWPLDLSSTPLETLKLILSTRFRQPNKGWWIGRDGIAKDGLYNFNSNYNVPWLLLSKLGIKRYITTNYDLELERALMLGGQLQNDPNQPDDKKPELSPFKALCGLRKQFDGPPFSWDLGSGRIRRVFNDGWAVESDLLNRERIDRMIEFAVGTDDSDGHVMHLHGRCDDWRSMIVSLRDYDRLYRHNDLNRAPFELAKKLMMGGNPLLFVGMGMTEQTLNRELEEFISNNPYQRVSPTFVLWSAIPGGMLEPVRRAKRLDLLRRLGVMTIFDTDLASIEIDEKAVDYVSLTQAEEREIGNKFQATLTRKNSKQFSASDIFGPNRWFKKVDKQNTIPMLKALANSVTALGGQEAFKKCPSLREDYSDGPWRTTGMAQIISSDPSKPTILWQDCDSRQASLDPGQSKKLANALASAPMVCIIGPQGCGKGYAARTLTKLIKADAGKFGIADASHFLMIHGNFSFDTDSLLDAVAQFLQKISAESWFEQAPNRAFTRSKTSRSQFFRSLNLGQKSKNRTLISQLSKRSSEVIIVINGMERFCGIDGRMLSAELDELFRLCLRSKYPTTVIPRIRWVLFGTERVRAYANDLNMHVLNFEDAVGADVNNETFLDKPIPNHYLATINVFNKWQDKHLIPPSLSDAIQTYRGNAAGRISGNSTMLRQSFFGAILDDDSLKKLVGLATLADITVARMLLRLLAFCGSPTELEVLLRARQWTVIERRKVKRFIEKLVQAKLVLRLQGFPAYPDHVDSVKTFGSDKPPIRYVLHRTLLTELRYRFGIPLNEAKLSTAFNMSLYVAQPLDGDIPDCDIHDELGDTIDRLIGSYRWAADSHVDPENQLLTSAGTVGLNLDEYKVVLTKVSENCMACDKIDDIALLRIDHLCRAEHVQSLRAALALIRSYYSTSGLLTLDSGDRLVREERDGILLEHAERLDDLIDGYGKIAMARSALRKVLPKNVTPENFKDVFGDAEPFYADELVWMHNERGVVRLAMGDLYEAERSFERALAVNRDWVERDDRTHNWRRIRLNQLTVDIEMGRIGTAERKMDELEFLTNPIGEKTYEDKLTLAIVKGYRAWTLQLHGQNTEARNLYDEALGAFVELKEARAQSYFSRLRADALDRQTSADERMPDIQEALHLAQATRQMDIVHRLNIKLADELLFGKDINARNRERGQRLLDDALSYALQTDVHRVRCEASLTIARARHESGDFEGALRFAMDAMMIACRYGMELRKISLRAIIAGIMSARGDPITAEYLARTCIKMATRQRYQNAIDKAEKVLLDLPRMSTAISGTDYSGRRRY